MKNSTTIIVLLIISTINLTVMIPGGGIDTRDFSQINPLVLGAFNTFLTSLGIICLFLSYFIYKKQKWATPIAFLCGLSYFLVYVLDLLKIFPKSPDAMPPLLLTLESLGVLLSIPLMYYSIKLNRNSENNENLTLDKKLYWILLIFILIGLGIIIFATNSAMTGK